MSVGTPVSIVSFSVAALLSRRQALPSKLFRDLGYYYKSVNMAIINWQLGSDLHVSWRSRVSPVFGVIIR